MYAYLSDTELKKGDLVWCLHCERVFSWDGESESCQYPGCDGTPLDFSLWSYDNWPRDQHPEYPEVPELGECYPLY